MAKVYADLIRKGIKTIDDVPEKLKTAVQVDHQHLMQKGGGRHGSSIRYPYNQGQKGDRRCAGEDPGAGQAGLD